VRTYAALAAIVLLALALRIAWLATTATVPPPLSDPQYYSATARNLADGRGYSVALDDHGFVAGPASESTAFWPPGYPFALAPLYKLTGSDDRAAKALNAIAGALTVLPIFYVARRLGRAPNEAVGLVAALIFAVAPASIFWTATLFSETLFTLGVATTLAVALWAAGRRSLAAYVTTGVVLAATAFVRSQGLVLVVPVAVLLAPSPVTDRPPAGARRLARVALPLFAGIALLVVPWAVRNQAAMGSPYLISDNLGYNLRLAHAPYAAGTTLAPQDLWDERPGISFHDREIFFADVGARRAFTYARTHPVRELQLAPRRIGWLLRSDAASAMNWSESLGATPFGRGRDALVLLGDVCWYALLALAAASLVVASDDVVRRDRLWLALWSTIAVWLALHLVFAGEPRYHVPLVPVLATLAATTAVRILDAVTPRGPNTRESSAADSLTR
jgi:hypothetical protein